MKINGVLWGPKSKIKKRSKQLPITFIPEQLEVIAVQIDEENNIVSEILPKAIDEPILEEIEDNFENEDKPKKKSRRAKELDQLIESAE